MKNNRVMKNMGNTEAAEGIEIQGLFDAIKMIMEKDPSAITNEQLKWSLKLNKKFSRYNNLSSRQVEVLQDIVGKILNKTRINTTS
jgi:FixJ family two-component response regulator